MYDHIRMVFNNRVSLGLSRGTLEVQLFLVTARNCIPLAGAGSEVNVPAELHLRERGRTVEVPLPTLNPLRAVKPASHQQNWW